MRATWLLWLLLGIILSLLPARSEAQHAAAQWYFGVQSGFDFRLGAPQSLTNSVMTSQLASAVLSDPTTGELLFYSNGEQVWNRYHQRMPHGDSLQGYTYLSQGVLALPVPEQSQQYYLFTLGPKRGSQIKLTYSLLDLRLNEGAGDVVPTRKNRVLPGSCGEQLTAIPHANGRDYWVLTREWGTDRFFVYGVTAQGVQLVHTIPIGPTPPPAFFSEGYLKASPDGRQVALTLNNALPVSLFDFDAATGQLSHYVNLGFLLGAGALSFSP